MTCKDCIHYFVCHRIINGGIPITWADKCGEFMAEQEPCDDAISRQAALEYFESIYPKNYADEPELGGASCVFSLNCIRKALDEFPSVNPQEPKPMMRTEEVKRAIDYLLGIWGDYGRHERAVEVLIAYIENLENELLQLPSVRPQEQTGHWIRITNGAMKEKYICSKCGRQIEDDGIEGLLPIKYPYCHCGAKMVEPRESEVGNEKDTSIFN